MNIKRTPYYSFLGKLVSKILYEMVPLKGMSTINIIFLMAYGLETYFSERTLCLKLNESTPI